MTWNRDKKSWIGKAVKLRNTLACRVLGGVRKWLGIVTRSLGEVKLWGWGILLHVGFWGGRFKKWLGLVTRRLGEVKLWSWGILLHVRFWGGGLENDLDSNTRRRGEGRLWSWDILFHVRFWGGGVENDLESNKKSWRGEAVRLRNFLACRVLGGGVENEWLGIVTRSLGEVKLWGWGILLLKKSWYSNKDSCSRRFLILKSNLSRCKSCLPNRPGLVSSISHQAGEF